MKLIIGGEEFNLINAMNASHYYRGANREAKQLTLDRKFDYSLFSDDMMDIQIKYDKDKIEDLWEYCILGEIYLRESVIEVYLCKKTDVELLQEFIDFIIGS